MEKDNTYGITKQEFVLKINKKVNLLILKLTKKSNFSKKMIVHCNSVMTNYYLAIKPLN